MGGIKGKVRAPTPTVWRSTDAPCIVTAMTQAVPRRRAGVPVRFGIGEWYGRSFVDLSPRERKYFAEIQALSKDQFPSQECPFLTARKGTSTACLKTHGICSIRKYQRNGDGTVTLADGDSGVRATCPNRLEEEATIYRWIGEVVLNYEDAAVLGQVPFLDRPAELGGGEGVGRIDNIMVIPDSSPLQWCAVEKQAVYFSGKRMADDFEVIAADSDKLAWPARVRRPDYRSSSTKRLMPQLLIKVPTLSTWGKKMAVVVDRGFFDSMGGMSTTNHLSNCEIVWFVVKYDENLNLARDAVYLTRLDQSVRALTAGDPVDRDVFEQRILDRLRRSRPA